MKKLLLLITLVAWVIAFALPVQATALTFELDYEFSGATPPESLDTPWLTAEFDSDENTPDIVMLTMEATNLTDAEYVNNWFFNLDPFIDVNSLTISYVSGVNATVLQDPKKNEYKADGDGLFDLMFDFPEPKKGDLCFGVNNTAEFSIVGTGITANSFNFLSETSETNETGYLSAALIGGIGQKDKESGWIGDVDHVDLGYHHAPEPATMLLLGSGLIGIAVSGKKRLKKRNG